MQTTIVNDPAIQNAIVTLIVTMITALTAFASAKFDAWRKSQINEGAAIGVAVTEQAKKNTDENKPEMSGPEAKQLATDVARRNIPFVAKLLPTAAILSDRIEAGIFARNEARDSLSMLEVDPEGKPDAQPLT